jgi:hypothetical protein
MHWGSAEKLVNFEAHDTLRSATIFGVAAIDKMLMTCFTGNTPSAPGSSWYEANRFTTDGRVSGRAPTLLTGSGSRDGRAEWQRTNAADHTRLLCIVAYLEPSMQSAFQWYDTGQSHVLNNITFRRCISSNPNQVMRTWELLTHSDQFVPENMQVRSPSKCCRR